MSYRQITRDLSRKTSRITVAHAIDGAHQMAMGLGFALAGMVLGVAMSLLIHQI
jgi:hypothetical protein